jgi:hypothetical protein
MPEKPTGKWKCRACGIIWDGEELYISPFHTVTTWTCGDLFCGATCDPVTDDKLIAVALAATRVQDADSETGTRLNPRAAGLSDGNNGGG